MKSLTIHNIDDPLLSLLKETAKHNHISINQFIKNLIENALGYKKAEKPKYYNEFKEFSNVWTVEEQKEFEKNTAGFGTIDKEDWQ
jgi:hypothetical protein